MTYTKEQLELQAHIDAENKAFDEKCRAEKCTFWTTTVSDPEHWARYGVTNIAEYERYQLESDYYELYKDVHNFRPSGSYRTWSTETLESEYKGLVEAYRYQQLTDEERKEEAAERQSKALKECGTQPNYALAGLGKLLEKGCS